MFVPEKKGKRNKYKDVNKHGKWEICTGEAA